MLVAIAGKSGSGKTTVCNILKEIDNSIYILEVDKIGHKSHKDKDVKKRIIQYFSKKILDENQDIDRKKLSDIVFKDNDKMKVLCGITKPYIEDEILKYVKDKEIVIIDYALLTALNIFKQCDLKILVKSDFEKRKARVMIRDNISDKKYIQIDNNSMDFDEDMFDIVIQNTGNIEKLREEVQFIYEKSIVSR